MQTQKVFVAGHRGMVGSAVVKQLEARGGFDIVTRSRADLDLTNQQAVDDFFTAEKFDQTQPMLSHINVGTGVDCTIKELTGTVAKVVGFEGEIVWDTSKPDGAPRKLMNVDRLKALGGQYSIELEDGLRNSYTWFLANQDGVRG
ncbi:MAG: NAD-dependent epimerase/dehydratase family protein [Aliidiomarina sp.]|uniref:NAD-dependent epimerase/dehydratase family protein n=1 Tax=Aliidiomarina sp. TaxID=1872439 RepID=UPI0025BD5453|nr:NAD-dependent epimerase/dehydratase family protein [Aliidiomarina sp.]MCH8502329.1 NAD-dependent epimerase/dehydratase family protein [Aliidiomarina sp.]